MKPIVSIALVGNIANAHAPDPSLSVDGDKFQHRMAQARDEVERDEVNRSDRNSARRNNRDAMVRTDSADSLSVEDSAGMGPEAWSTLPALDGVGRSANRGLDASIHHVKGSKYARRVGSRVAKELASSRMNDDAAANGFLGTQPGNLRNVVVGGVGFPGTGHSVGVQGPGDLGAGYASGQADRTAGVSVQERFNTGVDAAASDSGVRIRSASQGSLLPETSDAVGRLNPFASSNQVVADAFGSSYDSGDGRELVTSRLPDTTGPAVSDAVDRLNPFAAPDHIVQIPDDVADPHRRILYSSESEQGAASANPRVIRLEELSNEAHSRVMRIDENGDVHPLGSDFENTQHNATDATRGKWSGDSQQQTPEATSPAEPSSSVYPDGGGDVAPSDPSRADSLILEGQEASRALSEQILEEEAVAAQYSEELSKEQSALIDADIAQAESESKAAAVDEASLGSDELEKRSFDDGRSEHREASRDAQGEVDLSSLESLFADATVEADRSVHELSTSESSAPAREIPLEELVDVSDAELADLGEQTVRVEVDQDLAVEVSLSDDGVEVTLDGSRSSLDSMKGTEAEMERALRDAGHQLASFSERDRESGEHQRRAGQRRGQFSKQVGSEGPKMVRRGTYVNAVA